MSKFGTPRDLDDSDLDESALQRTDEDATQDERPEPESPYPMPVGVEYEDTFEPVEDDEDFINPTDADAEFEEDYNHEVLELPEAPEDEEEVDI